MEPQLETAEKTAANIINIKHQNRLIWFQVFSCIIQLHAEVCVGVGGLALYSVSSRPCASETQQQLSIQTKPGVEASKSTVAAKRAKTVLDRSRASSLSCMRV